MQPYKDIDGDSGVEAYEIGEGSITVKFTKGDYIYVYTDAVTGAGHVAEMQRLAQLGNGLNAYININVKKAYADKIAVTA